MVRGTLKPKQTEVPVVETAFEELRWAWYQEVVAKAKNVDSAKDDTTSSPSTPQRTEVVAKAKNVDSAKDDTTSSPSTPPRTEVVVKAKNVEAKDDTTSSPSTPPDPATFRSSDTDTSPVLEIQSSGLEVKQEGQESLDVKPLAVDSKQKEMKGRAGAGEDTEDTSPDIAEMVKIKRRSDSPLEEMVEPPLKPPEEVKQEDSEKLEKDAQSPEINEVTTSTTKHLTDEGETPPVEIKSEASPSKIAEIPTAEVPTNVEESKRSDNETAEVSATIKEDDGPKAHQNPEKSPDPGATPSKNTPKRPEDVAKAQVAFEVPQKTEMSEKTADEEVPPKPERNDPKVTDVPPSKPVESSTSVTAVGKKKVVWKNKAPDVASGVPVAKSKIIAKVPADLGPPGSIGSGGRKKVSWRQNQNKTSETETKNQEHQEHQDTDVPSDTSPTSKKVESGRVRTPRTPRHEEKVKPPVTVNVTDVDSEKAAPKSTEPRSRSKPSWRKATKAEERKGREDESTLSSSPKSSSPEKIEIETSERPSEKPAETSAPAEPEPSRPLEETFQEKVLPEAVVAKVLSVPTAPSASSRSASLESTTPTPATPSPSWRKMHISQYRDQRRRPGSTSPTRSRRTRSASARRERGDSEGAMSPRARWRGVPTTAVVQPGPGMEKKPRIKELRERNALIDAAINDQALRNKSHSVSHVWLRLHDMHKELHEKRSELVEKKRKEVEEQDLLIRLEYRPPRQAHISEVEAIASKLHGQKAEQEEKRKAALEEREKSLARIYCFAPTLSPKTRELASEVVGTHRISELYKDHQRRLQSKSQLSQQMEEKEQKSLQEQSVHKNVKNADAVHEASQKLFEDAQKRHQRLSERREQVLQRELQELQAMSIHKVSDAKIDFGDRLHEEAKRRNLRMMQKKEQAEEAAKTLRTRALSSPGLLPPGQGFKLLYEDAARREKSLLERQKKTIGSRIGGASSPWSLENPSSSRIGLGG